MSELFVPDKKNKYSKNLLDLNIRKFSDDVLIFGSGNFIFALPDFDSVPLVLKKRPDSVHGFCLHDGELYDTSLDMKIRHTLTDKVVAERTNTIQDIMSFEGFLYDCSNDKIYDTFTDSLLYDLEGDSWDHIFSMGFVNGDMYCGFGGIMKGSQHIYKVFGNKQVASRGDIPRVMCNYKDVLYDGGDEKIIRETLTSKEVVKRDAWVTALCVHKERMLDSGGYGRIYDTFFDKELYDCGFQVKCMVSVPKESLEVVV